MTRLLLACTLALAALPAVAQPNLNGGNLLSPVPERLDPGDTFSFPYSFANDGSQASPPTQVAFYFSTDRFLTDDDIFLGRQPIAGIGVQSNGFGSVTLTTPDVPRGGYEVLAVVDDPDIVAETDETDNVSGGRLTVGGDANGPDLLFSTGDLEDETIEPGGRVSVEYTIANRGGTDVGDFEVGYYLIRREQNPPPIVRIFLERETIGGLEAGEDNDESEQVTIPASTAPGDYNFIVIADDENVIEERNETNNSLGVAILTVTGTTAGEAAPGTEALGLRVSPNPSTAGARVALRLGAATEARIVVIDALGRTVAVLADARLGAGEASVAMPALPPGAYAVRVVTGEDAATARFTVVR